jgi:hypothetical protein
MKLLDPRGFPTSDYLMFNGTQTYTVVARSFGSLYATYIEHEHALLERCITLLRTGGRDVKTRAMTVLYHSRMLVLSKPHYLTFTVDSGC